MAQEVEAIVTDVFREKLARIYAGDAGLGAFSVPASFKIAEGGFTDPGSGKEPVPPDPTFTDVQAPSFPVGSQFVFQKTLLAGDLTFTSPTRCEIRCFVGTSEANDDGLGNPPEFFELGIFDGDSNMIVYSTFPIEIKTVSKSLLHLIFIDF